MRLEELEKFHSVYHSDKKPELGISKTDRR